MPIAPISRSQSEHRTSFLSSFKLNKDTRFAESTTFLRNGKINPLKFQHRIVHPLLANLPKNAISGKAAYHKNGRLKKATLAVPRIIQGIKLPKGTRVEFYSDGTLDDATLGAPCVIQGIRFPKGTKIDELFTNGKILRVHLAANQKFAGIHCRKGTAVAWQSNGKLDYCTTASAQRIQGILFPSNIRIQFGLDGKLGSASLGKNVVRVGRISLTGNLHFHKNGRIKNGDLVKDQTIQGIKCAKVSYFQGGLGGSYSRFITFHDNGKLKWTVIAAAQKIQGINCAKGRYVSLHRNGKLATTNLAKDQIIQGVPCSISKVLFFGYGAMTYHIALHPNGRLKKAVLSQNKTLQGIACASGYNKWVTFHDNGKLAGATLLRDTTISGYRCVKGSEIKLHRNGKLSSTNLVSARKIHGVWCAKGTVKLHPNGRVKSAALARSSIIWGTKFPAGTLVELDKRGKFTRVTLNKDAVIDGKRHKAGTSWGK